ncbi:MAG: hypothetical protein IKX63_01355 [Muribaculaceae bacterium]|nr:hypothetical protein [Muribaculaceae bacterium]
MKKFFTLFAAALIGLAAYAQCPSRLYFELAQEEQDASNVMCYLKLVNSTDYLNGFNMEVQKPEGAEWLMDEEDEDWVGFTGYGHVILANWDVSNPNQRETKLFQKADLKCNVKPDNGNLVIIEILSTLDCRFFPQLTETDDNTIARFSLNMSGCADGDLVITSDNTPSGCSFSYTGDPTETYNGAITIDEPIVLEVTKADGKVTAKTDVPPVEGYNEFYVVGTFNDWNQTEEGGRIALTDDGEGTFVGTVSLDAGAEFKIIAPDANGEWVWFGGADDNGVGYFELVNDLNGADIALVDGANFRTVEAGSYNIVVKEARGLVEPLVMTASWTATGISTINSDATDSRIFDLQGRELSRVPESGIYIQNGKKYVK